MSNPNESHLRLICAAALADGDLHKDEIAVLRDLATRLGLNEEILEDTLRDLDESHQLSVEFPSDPDQQKQLLNDLISLIVSDKSLSEREMGLLGQVGKAMEMSTEELQRRVDEALK